MIKENNDPNRRILPYCLGREHAPVPLHITANPCASSNLVPDPYYADYICEVRYQIPALAAPGRAHGLNWRGGAAPASAPYARSIAGSAPVRRGLRRRPPRPRILKTLLNR